MSMSTLSQIAAERDEAREELRSLKRVLADISDPGFDVPGETEAFTKQERRILCLLKKCEGRLVSKQGIMDAIYFDRSNDPPHEKIVHIWICKIRRKLQAHEIVTTWGVGWRLVPKQDITNV